MAKKRVKTKYTKAELKVFDKMIDQKLIDAYKQLDFYLDSIKDFAKDTDSRVKGLGEGIAEVEKDRLSLLASKQKKFIKHLENAKLRIQNGVYGICRETGALISEERLKAVPHATLSIAAKEKK